MAAAATACELLILAHSTGKGRPAVSAAHAGHDRVVSVHDAAARGAAVSCVERRDMVVDHRERVVVFARRNRVRLAECARVVSKIDPDPAHVSYGDP